MSYMQEVDMWLSDLLAVQGEQSESEWMARAKTEIKARILESYRNGQKTCPRCKGAKREFSSEGSGVTDNRRFRKSKSNT